MDKFSKILIVDDTVRNLRLLCTILGEEEYKVNVARNGVEALEMVNRNSFDLILLDIQMPVMDGFQTIKKLKEMPSTQNIPVIFLTAQNDKEQAVKGFELGAVDFVTKPFNTTELKVRIKTQVELKQHRENLEGAVKERTEQLEIAMRQLNSDNRAKESFLANISHEIRTPLNGIQGMTSLLSSTELNEEQQNYLKTLKYSTGYLSKIVEDLIDYTELNSGIAETNFEDFNLVDAIKSCCEIYNYRTAEKGIDFEVDFATDFPELVNGDRTMLKKVISHLLSNALKFTEEGHIKLYAATEEDLIVITVTDSGIGIEGDDFEKIFHKFTPLDSSSSRNYEGVGMGLAICKKKSVNAKWCYLCGKR
jgi:signal transduction histidine kinase